MCQTLKGIAAHNGTQRKHFKERSNYEGFYEYVCHIMLCSFENVEQSGMITVDQQDIYRVTIMLRVFIS